MRTRLLAFVLLLTSCAALFASDPPERGSAQALPQPAGGIAARFAAPAKPWSIDLRGGQARLLDLVASFEAASGEHVTFSDAVRVRLSTASIGLTSNATVPPDQIYTWFEVLIAREGFRLYVATHDEPRMLALVAPGRQGDWNGTAFPVRATELAALDRHPALIVHAVLDLTPVDARQVANGLRALQTDQSSVCTAPSESMLVATGTATEVALLIRAAEDAKRVELARRESAPPVQPPPPANR